MFQLCLVKWAVFSHFYGFQYGKLGPLHWFSQNSDEKSKKYMPPVEIVWQYLFTGICNLSTHNLACTVLLHSQVFLSLFLFKNTEWILYFGLNVLGLCPHHPIGLSLIQSCHFSYPQHLPVAYWRQFEISYSSTYIIMCFQGIQKYDILLKCILHAMNSH
jgi:hypothetical protein